MNRQIEIVYIKSSFEKIDTLIKTTRKAMKLYSQPKLKIIKKLSNKNLYKIFETIFKDLPFEVYFQQTIKDSIYRAKPIRLECLNDFDLLSKKEIVNELPLKMKNELIMGYEKSDRKIKSLGVFLPFYQVTFVSNKSFYGENTVCLYGEFKYEPTN